MGQALPPFLVSILAPCLEHGATHVDIGRTLITLYIGEDTLGDAPSPEGQFDEIVGLIRSFSEPDGEAGTPFESRKAIFQSPEGPLPVDVEIHEDKVRLVFDTDAHPADAESIVNEALSEAVRIGAQRLAFATAGIAFWKDGALEGVADFDAILLADVVAFARKLGNIPDDKRKGMAVLMGEGRAMTLTIQILEMNGEDTVVITRSE